MTSFVDLMADDRWSEADVVNRMESMIRTGYSAAEEAILNRKIIGTSQGFYTMTADEQAEVASYAQVCEAAQLAGRSARADMALLSRVLDAESGAAELDPADADGLALMAQRAAARAQNEGNIDATSTAPVDPVSPDSP